MISLAENTVGSTAARAPEGRRSAPTGTKRERDIALDFVKGGLVLCMVGYHTLNYFRYDVSLLRHLHFLPSSFIFIAGFLISSVYLPRSQAEDFTVYRRLFVRGLKTLALFSALNLLVHALFSTSYNRNLGLDVLLDNLQTVFLTGEQRTSVFGVLLPISYLLLLAAALLRLSRRIPAALPVSVAGTFIVCATLAQQDRLVFNLDLLSMGLLGMVAGFAPKTWLLRATERVPVIAVAYLLYSVAIRTWYPTYLINTLGVALSLLLLYTMGRRVGTLRALAAPITLLGHYSLFAYLAQIAVLQLQFRIIRRLGMFEGHVAAPLALSVILTFAAVKTMDYARARSRVVNRAYEVVFA